MNDGDRTGAFGHRIEDGIGLFAIGDIQMMRAGARADLVGKRSRCWLIDVGYGHVSGASRGECSRRGTADPVGRARHKYDLVFHARLLCLDACLWDGWC